MCPMKRSTTVLLVAGVALFAGVQEVSAARRTRIIFSKNLTGSDPECIAVTVSPRIPIERQDTITWKLDNDNSDGNACPAFDSAQVSLDFGSTNPLVNVTNSNRKIKADVRTNAVEQVQSDLKFFDALIADNPDLMRLVRSPVFAAEEQAKALAAVLAKAGISGTAANFLRVVASNRRLVAVRDTIDCFRRAGA